ncbi:MAG: DoxX family protein [Desulfuromonadaceae bacterium]|nr:DoxX family protein [Desulfuromonadaceae bacterium]
MLKKLLATPDDLALLILRLVLGGVFFIHGAQKALGWFGGHGLPGTLDAFTQGMGLPLLVAVLIVAAEFLGPIGLIVGFLTRPAAAGIFAVMVGAIGLVHLKHGFFMNWFDKQAGEGYGYHLLAIGISRALVVGGGGKASIDRLLSRE